MKIQTFPWRTYFRFRPAAILSVFLPDNPLGDYHITGGPAVNGGTSLNAPSTDIDDGSRPVGAGFDIGADELGAP